MRGHRCYHRLGRWLLLASMCCAVYPAVASSDSGGIEREVPALQEKAVDAYLEAYPGVSRAEAHRRVALQDDVAPALAQIRERFGQEMAGTWFDPLDGGQLKVGVGGPASTAKQAALDGVRDLLRSRGVLDKAAVVPERNSMPELMAAQRALDDLLAGLIRDGKVATGLQVPRNSVRVLLATSLTHADRARVQAVAASAPVTVEIEQTDASTLLAEPAACTGTGGNNGTYLYCGLPLRGGVSIFEPFRCTLGFNVRSPGGAPYVLTAGHCLAGHPTAWATRNAQITEYVIGPRVDWRYSETGDFGLIQVGSGSHWYQNPPAGMIFVDYSPYSSPGDPGTALDESYPIDGASTSAIGQVLCLTSGIQMSDGRYTDCSLVKELNRTHTYTDGVTLQGMGVLGANASVQGSSGGPIYKNGRGYGLFSGSWKANNEEYYQGLSEVLDTFNVSLPPVDR